MPPIRIAKLPPAAPAAATMPSQKLKPADERAKGVSAVPSATSTAPSVMTARVPQRSASAP